MIGRRRACVACALAFTSSTLHAQAGEREGPTHAQRRLEWFYQQRAFPFGSIPPGALDRARTQLGSSRLRLLMAPPPIDGSKWQALGPTLLNPTNAIGRISAIAIHPTNANIIYIGGAQGGVWKTTDGGATWSPRTDRECSLAMGSIALDPVDPEIVYAATGEQHFSGDSYYGCGVLRSTDGGATWTRLGATTFVRSRISRIVVVPSTAGTVATTTLLVASDNGVWRSTDGGGSWTQLRAGSFTTAATDLVLDPTNDQVVYVAIRTLGVFRSADRGTTWGPLGAGFPVLPATSTVGRINLAIAASAPSTLYASVHNTNTNGLLGIYTTTDAGATWTQLSAQSASCGSQCWYDQFITVHPTDPNTVYFGGVLLYRSTNGGITFGSITSGIHVDQHLFAFDPTNASRVFVVNDGGIYRSDNGGTSWTPLNNGLALTQFYSGISLHPWDPTVVLGGTQDNGTMVSGAGTSQWTVVLGADGGFTAIDPENPTRRYGETQWSGTFSGPRRSDGGSFALKISGIDQNDPALFIPPLVMDPAISTRLYFGTTKLYRTIDAAESWSVIRSGFSGAVSAIGPAASDSMTVYAGASSGQVHVTEDGGTTWNVRTTGLPVRFITDIAVDRADARTAYVTVSGFGTGHVFRTTNGGVNWTNVSLSLPDMPVNAVALDPASRAFVTIGTDLGVFVSSDSGASWKVLDDGMPNVAVFDIAYNAATGALIAATHGRGMFQLQLNRALTIAATPKRRRVTMLEGSSAAVADSSNVILSGSGAASAGWAATHRSAATWLTLTTATGTGSSKVRWRRSATGLTPGTYVDTIQIASAGAVDSPVRIIDTTVIESAVPLLTVSPTKRGSLVSAESGETVPDSASISLTGATGPTATWTATARKGTWLTLSTASGTGSGRVRWTRRPLTLPAGVVYDTVVITVPNAVGSPAFIADSMIVRPAIVASPATRLDTMISGSAGQRTVSSQVSIRGDAGGTTSWTVSHGGGAWITLKTTSGQGAMALEWNKSAENLRDGIFIDTITVSSPTAATLRIVDTLRVVAPLVTKECASDHLLGQSCLDATQRRWLDLAGNNDGAFNLGDLLALLSRTPAPPPAMLRGKQQ